MPLPLQASLVQSTAVVFYKCKKNNDEKIYKKTRRGLKIKKAVTEREEGTRN